MPEKFGVENFIKVLDVGLEIGNAAGVAMDDGQITVGDAGAVLMVMDELMALGTVKWDLLPKELKDFDAEDRAVLETHIKTKFDIPQDKVEAIIEECVGIVGDLVSVVIRTASLVKQAKSV